MKTAEERELEVRMARLRDHINGWDAAERRSRACDMKIRLEEEGLVIDAAAEEEIKKFSDGHIGLAELSKFFQGKFLE